jgi:hypothetical protein
MPCTKLTVRRIGQINSLLCGAASAHMILVSLKFLTSSSNATQNAIWTDIQANTGTPPAGFPVIEGCSPPLEWATHPIALQKTLNARMGRNATDVIAEADEDATAGLALKSVKQGIAAAVLVQDTFHWIVVIGCSHSQLRKFREVVLNGDPVTHILVRDPAEGGYRKKLTLDGWAVAMSAVRCGTFDQKYIVVGAT